MNTASASANVAVLVFDGVEPLDFCGPFEVFSAVKQPDGSAPFSVFTCAEKAGPVETIGGLSINPRFEISQCPPIDLLVIPGGWGTRDQLENRRLLDWLRATAPQATHVLSVCTGALLLAKAGLLDGLSATTHHEVMDLLHLMAPKTTIRRWERFVDNGQIVVAAGISAGIDAALHLVQKRLGKDIAIATAHYMEYRWEPRLPGPQQTE